MSSLSMPTNSLNLAAPEVTSAEIPDTNLVRLGRVLLCSLMLFVLFFHIDHDFSFAGKQIGDIKEEAIKNQYVREITKGDSLRKLLLVGFAGVGVASMLLAKGRPLNVRTAAVALFLMLVSWAILSVLWSEIPGLTLKRLGVSFCVLLGTIGLARLLRPSEYLYVALLTLTTFVSMSLLADVAAGGRPWSSSHRFGGSLHPNNQAFYCGTICLAAFCLASQFKSRWLMYSVALYGAMALYATQSRTSFLAMLIGLAMIFFLRLSKAIRWFSLLAVISMISMGMIVYNGLSTGDRATVSDSILMGRTEQSSNLTGRVPLWEELVKFSARRPMTGYGYEAFWSPENISAIAKSQQWTMQSAHNAYFEVVLQLGYVGLFLILLLVATSINLAQKAYELVKEPGYAFIYGMFFFALVNGLLESHPVKFKYPTTIIIIGMAMLLLYFPEEEEEADEITEFADA